MQILIFRTSISTRNDLKRLRELLNRYPQVEKWNVDLEDWEKIFRIHKDYGLIPDLGRFQYVRVTKIELDRGWSVDRFADISE